MNLKRLNISIADFFMLPTSPESDCTWGYPSNCARFLGVASKHLHNDHASRDCCGSGMPVLGECEPDGPIWREMGRQPTPSVQMVLLVQVQQERGA